MSRQPGERPTPGRRSTGPNDGGKNPQQPQEQNWRWAVVALVGLVAAAVILPGLVSNPKREELGYGALIEKAKAGQVVEATVNNDSGKITGSYKAGDKTVRYSVTGPHPIPDNVEQLLREKVPPDKLNFDNTTPNLLASLIPFLLPILLLIGFWIWFSRRAQSQVGGIMSIGRSKAKVYTTERPKTTFADVAGYEGVKQEINEVVDFLKSPGRFKEIGARHPEGRTAGRSAGHRKDTAGPSGGRRGGRALHVGHRLGLHGDVRRRRRFSRAAISSRPRASRPRRSSSSTRSTRLGGSGAPASVADTTSASRRLTRCFRRWMASRRLRAS